MGSHFTHTQAVAPHSAALWRLFLLNLQTMALRANLLVDPILLTVRETQGVLYWREIFGNANPVELEIGSGKGAFLLAAAGEHPERNFIGLEWARAYCHYAADRLRRHGRTNCRMVRAEAQEWIRAHVAEASLAAVHIYFPDPWPKTRHHKRRLVQPAFWRELERILKPGGVLRIVTDHEPYFRFIEQVAAEACPMPPECPSCPQPMPGRGDAGTSESLPGPPPPPPDGPGRSSLRRVAFDAPLKNSTAQLVGTNFEQKYAREGRPFYALAAVKDA